MSSAYRRIFSPNLPVMNYVDKLLNSANKSSTLTIAHRNKPPFRRTREKERSFMKHLTAVHVTHNTK